MLFTLNQKSKCGRLQLACYTEVLFITFITVRNIHFSEAPMRTEESS